MVMRIEGAKPAKALPLALAHLKMSTVVNGLAKLRIFHGLHVL